MPLSRKHDRRKALSRIFSLPCSENIFYDTENQDTYEIYSIIIF